MRRDSFLVEDDGSTPDKPLVACFYCLRPVGTEHAAGCVMRRRTVVLRITTEIVAYEAEDSTSERIAFYYNEGRWCADNLADLIAAHIGGDDEEEHGCLCPVTRVEYVREATEEDELRSAIRIARWKD